MEPDRINPRGPKPVYIQLAAVIRRQIISGKLKPDEAIPSQTYMTRTYGVSRGSVAHAVAVLLNEGLLSTVKGKGVYVTPENQREAAAKEYRSQRLPGEPGGT